MRKRLTKVERQAVYDKFEGCCAYCGCELDIQDMQVDHIESIRRHESDELNGEDTTWLNKLENLNPACRSCNFYKGEMSIESFRKQLNGILNRLDKVFIFRLAVKYGLIRITPNPIRFYFERNTLNK